MLIPITLIQRTVVQRKFLLVCLKYSSLLLSFDVTDNFTASFHFATAVCTVTVSYPTQ